MTQAVASPRFLGGQAELQRHADRAVHNIRFRREEHGEEIAGTYEGGGWFLRRLGRAVVDDLVPA